MRSIAKRGTTLEFMILPEPPRDDFADATSDCTSRNDQQRMCACAPAKVRLVWTRIYSSGVYGDMPGSRVTFNTVFRGQAAIGDAIIRRECFGCTHSHRDVYFKRLTVSDSFDAYDNMLNTLSDSSNRMGTDFSIFSSLDDALNGHNPWEYCNLAERSGVGFPRDCGPTKRATSQWNSLTQGGGQASVRISVYAPDGELSSGMPCAVCCCDTLVPQCACPLASHLQDGRGSIADLR